MYPQIDDGVAPMSALPVMQHSNVVPFPIEETPQMLELRRRIIYLSRLASLENAASEFGEDILSGLGQRVVREFKLDKDSRAEWEKTATRAMDIARQKREGKSEPWENASDVKYPILTTAALQFAARAYPAIVDGPRIVKTTVLGKDDEMGSKAAAADRVSQHMSYQLLQEMPSWEEDMDTCLHQIPIVGCAFKKVYPDPDSEAGACSDLVSAFDMVVNQSAKSLSKVPRITQILRLYPHEIRERIQSGLFDEIDIKAGSEGGEDDDAQQTVLEQHRYWDSDGDGVPEPWIITVHERLGKVLRMRTAFDIDKMVVNERRGVIVRLPRKQYFVKIPFVPDPEGGFYDIGFGKLLEAISDIIDTTINQMMDAGTLQNSGGGFIGGTLQLGKGKLRMKPGEYHKVPSSGDDIRKSIVSMEHPGPAPVLFQLLQLMIEAGKDVASVKDVLTGETPSNQTATSTMAMIEQGLKVFTAIYKRIYRALKTEYRLIFEINRDSLQTPKYVALLDEPIEVVREDYHGQMDIMPVADPNTVTDMQRMAKAQVLMEQVANGNPTINPFQATKRALEAARIERIPDVMNPPPDPNQPPPPSPEEIVAQIKAKGLEDEINAKREMADIDMHAKLAELDRKMQEGEMKLSLAAAQLKIKEAELELQERALDLKARETELKGVEGELKHEAASKGYQAKMADLHREHGLPGADDLQELMKSVAAAREELGLLRQRRPRSIRFRRGDDGSTTHVETDEGVMQVKRGPDGMPVSLDPMEDDD